ncbi:MAG: HAD-IA family hydrolase [Fibrobacteria bacterium]|nr:HAD-IA family hydrolase [Fibrobacteria bacterium]
MRTQAISLVLFDLGGVLERVAAAPRVEAWTRGRIPADKFWSSWLAAESVRSFETGSIEAEEFARQAVVELGLPISPEDFLQDFASWLAGPFEGAFDLVRSVAETGVEVASFSNSNAVHWPIMERHQRISECFPRNFPSHLLGLCKPDREAFLAVADRLEMPPGRILFLDDNQVNVEGSLQAGMNACRCEGVEGARTALKEWKILS